MFSVIFRTLVRGYISNSGENYNLFEIPADKPKTVSKSRQNQKRHLWPIYFKPLPTP